MADIAHEATDKILNDIEKRLRKEYRQATKDVEQKLDDYFAAFARKDEKKRELLKAGEITQQEYNNWRYGQMCVGKRWEDMRDKLAAELTRVDVIARNMSDGYMPEVYAINHNFATYQIETGGRVDTSYTLYDAQTVERLVRENPQILPQVGRTTQQLIDDGIIKKWNMKNIQSTAIQGILQGESIPNLAKRMARDVGASNYKDCVRHARTMTTATQNAGRVDGFKRAKGMGIDVVQEWVATIDGRTRHEHRQLNGQRREAGEPFEVDGYKLAYPADPTAPYYLIMNCRCTLVGQVKGFETDTVAYRNDKDMGGMTYEEWRQAKAPKKARGNAAQAAKTPDAAKAKPAAKELHANDMEIHRLLKMSLDKNGIDYVPVTMHADELTTEQIINKLAGADKTQGSCASLALCYAANKHGIDVEDFKGGNSQSFFSRDGNFRATFKTANANLQTFKFKKEVKETTEMLAGLDPNKEYILSCGRHAAAVRKNGDVLEYLELQSAYSNGWKPFTNDTLKKRFGCRVSEEKISAFGMNTTVMKQVDLIDIDTFEPTEEFKDILGYINTDPAKQKKGAGGGIK